MGLHCPPHQVSSHRLDRCHLELQKTRMGLQENGRLVHAFCPYCLPVEQRRCCKGILRCRCRTRRSVRATAGDEGTLLCPSTTSNTCSKSAKNGPCSALAASASAEVVTLMSACPTSSYRRTNMLSMTRKHPCSMSSSSSSSDSSNN